MRVAVTVQSPLQALADLLNETANDPETDAPARVAALRGLRTELASLVGIADRYIADQELRREGDAMARIREHIAARAAADVRGAILDAGGVTPEALDAAGLLSHDELDRRAADGTLEETWSDIARSARLGRELVQGRSALEEARGRQLADELSAADAQFPDEDPSDDDDDEPIDIW